VKNDLIIHPPAIGFEGASFEWGALYSIQSDVGEERKLKTLTLSDKNI
jgi:hypothetical protein